jgi:hypothetical protein
VGLNPLVLIGVACVIAAIVGGGLKLTGIEIPLLTSVRRQVLLGALGIGLAAGVGIAGVVGTAPPGDGAGVRPSLPGAPGCYGRLFRGIAQDRIASLEDGTRDRPVIRQDQPKDEPVGLAFTQNGHAIGALTLRFFPADGLFKIARVVDSRCGDIARFSNADRPGSAKNTLQNWDTLRVQFGDHSYTARFGSEADIRVSFNREA